MSDTSTIEWTDATWNPVRGCTKVSPGCANCYAETFAERWRGVPGHSYEQGFDLRLVPEKLTEPLKWKKPRRIFVNSMSDLFQEGVPDSFIDQVFAVMALARRHTFQVLTKRAERMRTYCLALTMERIIDCCNRNVNGGPHGPGAYNLSSIDGRTTKQRFVDGEKSAFWPLTGPPLPNVWLGVSVENQHFADERIPLLLQTPAAVRFISAEPLLEGVTFKREWLGQGSKCPECGLMVAVDEDGCCASCGRDAIFYGLDWVIVGGESGHGARPFNVAWARSIVAQCKAAGVPCFVKQLGARPMEPDAEFTAAVGKPIAMMLGLRNRKGGDPSEWPADLRVREMPAVRR